MAGVLAKLTKRAYWNKVNTIEFLSFSVKLAIIIPGLLLGVQFWWMYLLALITSLFLILTSTIKTLPTIANFFILLRFLQIQKMGVELKFLHFGA